MNSIPKDLVDKKFASANNRVFAFLIDVAILYVAEKTLLIATNLFSSIFPDITYGIEIASFVLIWGYYIIMHALYGATFGKMAMKIKILKDDYTPVDFKTAFLRYCPYVAYQMLITLLIFGLISELIPYPEGQIFGISALIFCGIIIFVGIPLLWFLGSITSINRDLRNRAYHDKIAKTVVIEL